MDGTDCKFDKLKFKEGRKPFSPTPLQKLYFPHMNDPPIFTHPHLLGLFLYLSFFPFYPCNLNFPFIYPLSCFFFHTGFVFSGSRPDILTPLRINEISPPSLNTVNKNPVFPITLSNSYLVESVLHLLCVNTFQAIDQATVLPGGTRLNQPINLIQYMKIPYFYVKHNLFSSSNRN